MARAIDIVQVKCEIQAGKLAVKCRDNDVLLIDKQSGEAVCIATIAPSNEWVNRVRELDDLYTKLYAVTGFTAEQLLEMFVAGYTLEKPDYSKSFEEMASLTETTPPNEPLTLEELREKIEDARLEGYAKGLGEMNAELEQLKRCIEIVEKQRDAAIKELERYMRQDVLEGNEPCVICAKASDTPCEGCDPKWYGQKED